MRTLFVGGAREGSPPAHAADRLVPLDALARARLGGVGPDLRAPEAQATAVVAGDLDRFVEQLDADSSLRRWLRAGQTRLHTAIARADGLAIGFPAQWVAHRVAREQAPEAAATWGASAFQADGVAAALGRSVPSLEPGGRALPAPTVASAVGPPGGEEAGGCDILYLALEPHVARQQDRLLALLASRYRLRVVVPLRRPWTWPEDTRFRPGAMRPLRTFLEAGDYARLGTQLAIRTVASAGRLPRIGWMPGADSARFLRSTWLRSAHADAALSRAIARLRPRLLLGTNLTSGLGAVITQTASRAGVAVVGLPSGADYMLPPLCVPASTRHAHIVVPGEYVRSALIQAGADADRVIACGWPEMDDLVSGPRKERAATLADLGLPGDCRLAVFFSSPSSGAEAAIVPPVAKREAFLALADACDAAGARVVVKLHPRERDDTIPRAAAGRAVAVPVVRDDLASLLAAADVVASLGSAVGFAAAAMGKSVLVLGFGALGALGAPSAALGIGEAPGGPEELRACLERALHEGGRRHGDLLGADGRSSERIADLVARLLA